jgi:hypothetical protein
VNPDPADAPGVRATAEPGDQIGMAQLLPRGEHLHAVLHGPITAPLVDALTHLRLRVYHRDAEAGDRTDYVVLDMHGVSIGVKRRAGDLYLHVDTTETDDTLIAFEINGTGEVDHSIH